MPLIQGQNNLSLRMAGEEGSHLHIPRRMKKYDKVLEKIRRLKHRYSRVSGQYQIDVVKDKQTGNAVQLTWKRHNLLELESPLFVSTYFRF